VNEPEVWSIDPVTRRWVVEPLAKPHRGLLRGAMEFGAIAAIMLGWLFFAVWIMG
jgi:hypothetical protein